MKKEAIIIDLPDAELMKAMIEEAWSHFIGAAKKAGWNIPEEDKALAKDFFVAGYCHGYNDLRCTIAEQLGAEEAANDLIEGL
jgi:hypothetical protein